MPFMSFCLAESMSAVSSIDSGISNVVHDFSKLPMTKIIHNGRLETTITAEKDNELKKK